MRMGELCSRNGETLSPKTTRYCWRILSLYLSVA
jgi:hypothetical protein